MALTTAGNVKLILGITGTAQDAKIAILVDAADKAVKNYCKRDLESQSYTEYYTGSGTDRLPLNQYPVTAVASVYIDAGGKFGQGSGAFPSSSLLTNGLDYALEWTDGNKSNTGCLVRLGGYGFAGWPTMGNWQTVDLMTLQRNRGSVWPQIPGSIKVTYTAGFSDVPDDLRMACENLTCWLFRAAPLGGDPITSESLGSYSYSLASQALSGLPALGSTRQLLSTYRRPVL